MARKKVDLFPERINLFVKNFGVNCIWEKAILCSCMEETESESPALNCPACNGKGYFYFDPQEIVVTLTSAGTNKDQTPIGLLDVGTALVTAPVEYRISFRDRLIFTNSTTSYSEVKRHSGDPNGDLLNYPCYEIISVRRRDMEIPSSDYTFTEGDRYLKFNPGVLNPGDAYSVLYRIKPVYVVIDIPHELRGTYVSFHHPQPVWYELPKQYMIKREDLLPYQRGQVI